MDIIIWRSIFSLVKIHTLLMYPIVIMSPDAIKAPNPETGTKKAMSLQAPAIITIAKAPGNMELMKVVLEIPSTLVAYQGIKKAFLRVSTIAPASAMP